MNGQNFELNSTGEIFKPKDNSIRNNLMEMIAQKESTRKT